MRGGAPTVPSRQCSGHPTTLKESIETACAAHPTADVFINFASYRSCFLHGCSETTIKVIAIIAEGVPESDTKQLIAYARVNNKVVVGPATVGGIQAGAFKIGDTAGTIDNIIQCKLYRSGSVGFVSKSPCQNMVVLGELGGWDEYSLVEALKQGKVNKLVVAWVSGTCARLFKLEVQFGRAVKEGKITPVKEFKPPQIPEDLDIAIESRKVRAPIHVISTISDDRDEEPCYAGIPMSSIVEQGFGVGDVISLLWFKRSLPRYCTHFIEADFVSQIIYGIGQICIMLCVDHGPCVSGAHNTKVTARAGKDLVSSLVSGLLTIGPRFGGAIDDAARYFKDAYDRGLSPYEFVESMKKKGIRVPGIRNSGMFSKPEIDEIVEIGYLNGLFMLARSIGLIGYTFDQKRLKQSLYRHPWEYVLYTK
ncbi:hypothetical protein HHK36_020898 [Tetracentron sinense]|uniref:ATP citrate synthase n=1 Tax=Tetracentron sinense TaxID=13715 RepID=A0A835D989_TETSI|nr:hypothetical protein HHK36_020898 [Tetracentron sinense]